MATIHHSHQRTPSSGHKFVLRPTSTRPNLTKNTSSSKLSSKAKRQSVEADTFADDSDMTMSFHQYCTTCEKQMVVPNASILYCSESCRRRDGTIGIAIGAPPSPPLLSEYEAFTKRPALSRRKLHPAMSSHSIPTVLHEGDADMDPTEWKPDGTSSHPGGVGGSTRSTAPHTHVPRTHSEAHLYLSQFHRSSDSLGSSGGRRAKKDIKHLAGTAPGIGAVAGKGFSLTPGGSNESSVAGSPVESASASISGLTNGTAPSITFDPAHEDEVDGGKVMMVNGMGFSKQKVEARDDADGSLAKLLAASVVA